MSKWDYAMDQEALEQEQERLDRRIRNRLFYEQEAISEIATDKKALLPESDTDNASLERKKLKRDIRAEALTRLEDAARTTDDFQKVVEWWDKLDANRERRERYHEISRSGDELPLDHGVSPDELFFPDYLNDVLFRQIQKGDFLDAIFNCPYEIHELVTEEYLSKILWELPEDSKELLFLWAVRLYSTARIASIRSVTDRNIRKVRNTLLNRIQKKLLAALLEKEAKQQSMTILEKEFLTDNRAKVDRQKKKSYNANMNFDVLGYHIICYRRWAVMKNTSAKDAMNELTMLLLYLSRFTENERFAEAKDFYAWKGYNFDVLNKLDEEDYIHQGSHPSRSKSVYITDRGMERAKELLKKYGINDWE